MALSDQQHYWRSFAGGELSSELFGRLDLGRYQTGMSEVENFIVLPHGPLANRPGSVFTNEVKDSSKDTRIIEFIRDENTALVIEVGDQYMRFHRNGGTVLNTAKTITSITKATQPIVTSTAHGYSDGDWVYLDVVGMVELSGRFAVVSDKDTNTFKLKDTAGNYIDTTNYTTFTSGTCADVYELATPYLEADLFDLHYVQAVDTITICHPDYQEKELIRTSDTSWALSAINFDPDIAAPTNFTINIGGAENGSARALGYAITAISAETLKESYPLEGDGLSRWFKEGNDNLTIGWDEVPGALRYNIYRTEGGAGAYFFIGQAHPDSASGGSLSFVDGLVVGGLPPDFAVSPPEDQNPFTGPDTYPSTVSFFQQRRAFAGSNDEPQRVWWTRSGVDDNMTASLPPQDDDAFSFRMAATKANVIRHLVTLKDMIIFTAGAVWRVVAAGSDVITPNNVDIQLQEHHGATNVQPVASGDTAIYVSARGSHVRVLRYDNDSGGYVAQDVSLLAAHLVDYHSIVDMTFQESPQRIWWGVRDDGVLLGMTYVPEQDVLGWHRQTFTNGAVKSVASIPENGSDSTYMIIERTVDGRTVKYIEYFAQREFAGVEDAYFVDAGLTYDGSAATTIRGLHHLEGQTVSILADGIEEPSQVVTDGEIELEIAASKVHVGLPITAKAATLPLAYETKAGEYGMASARNINSLRLRVERSLRGVQAGPDYDSLRLSDDRDDAAYDAPGSLFTGITEISLDPEWAYDGQVVIQHEVPLPLMITAMVPDFVEA